MFASSAPACRGAYVGQYRGASRDSRCIRCTGRDRLCGFHISREKRMQDMPEPPSAQESVVGSRLLLSNRNSFFKQMIGPSRESIRNISFSAHVRCGERGAPVLFYAGFVCLAGFAGARGLAFCNCG